MDGKAIKGAPSHSCTRPRQLDVNPVAPEEVRHPSTYSVFTIILNHCSLSSLHTTIPPLSSRC